MTTRLRHIGLLGGERIAKLLNMASRPATMLRIIRQTQRPITATPQGLGVDEWAMRRGKVSGTILVDLERQPPIEWLTDRSADTLAAWLRSQPGIQIISRDRSTDYIRGASQRATGG